MSPPAQPRAATWHSGRIGPERSFLRTTVVTKVPAQPSSTYDVIDAYANPAYAGPAVLQQRFTLPCMDGVHPVLGAWVVGDDPAGMGIREDANPITGNTSNFVPHYFE